MSETLPQEKLDKVRTSSTLSQRPRNPAIDRMDTILSALERAPDGLDLADVTQRSGVARSSAYRILNSLEHHGFVQRRRGGVYTLGARLFALGEAVSASFQAHILPNLLQGWMERLATETGETVRLSAQNRGTILLIGAATPATSHALSANIGQKLPAHAGGASKILLAHMPVEDQERLLRTPLEAMTSRTITEPRALKEELARIREQGWAADPGEFSMRVQSCAMPLRRNDGSVVAAVSIAYVATEDQNIHDTILTTLKNRVPEAEALLARL